MKTVGVKGSIRASVGKSDTKKVRNAGNVPCVLYAGGKEATHFSLEHKVLKKVLFSPEIFIVQVELDGTVYDTIIRESQFHPVTDQILHVDFLKVDDQNPVEFELPVRLTGNAKGVLSGGKLVAMLRRLKVEGIPAKMPDKVEVDVSDLELGKSIRVKEVDAPGIKITSPPMASIARVEIPRALKSAQSEEEEAVAE